MKSRQEPDQDATRTRSTFYPVHRDEIRSFAPSPLRSFAAHRDTQRDSPPDRAYTLNRCQFRPRRKESIAFRKKKRRRTKVNCSGATRAAHSCRKLGATSRLSELYTWEPNILTSKARCCCFLQIRERGIHVSLIIPRMGDKNRFNAVFQNYVDVYVCVQNQSIMMNRFRFYRCLEVHLQNRSFRSYVCPEESRGSAVF